jgi:peptidoglycan/LPS O-acetylase OafA/YrhL
MMIEAASNLETSALITAPARPQLKALTSIRFFAALQVVLYHFVHPFSLWGPFTGFMAAGYTGVSFFFLLSGFILTYSHASEPATPDMRNRFYFARFARIYPVYIVVLIGAGILVREQFAHRIHIMAFIADILLVQSWSVRMVSFFNMPAWSVSSEAFFYLIFPFALTRLLAENARQALQHITWLWLAAMAAPVWCLIKFPEGAWREGGGIAAFAVRRIPVLSLPEFLIGIPLAWWLLHNRPSPRTAAWMATLAIGCLLITLYFADSLPALAMHNGLLIPIYSFLLIGLSQQNWISRILSWFPFVVLGEASYSLYLTHFLLRDWAERVLHLNGGLQAAAIKLAMVIPLSLALHYVIERPCRRWLLRQWNIRHGAISST